MNSLVVCQKSDQSGDLESFETDCSTEAMKNNSNPKFNTCFMFVIEDAKWERVRLRFVVVDSDSELEMEEQSTFGKYLGNVYTIKMF